MYRITTEDKHEQDLKKIMLQHFPGFSILKGEGCWKGEFERSIAFEIATDNVDLVNSAALSIKKHTSQEAVLVQHIPNRAWFI